MAKKKGRKHMKKKVLLIAALFLVMLSIAFVPARTAQAKGSKYSKLNGKYYFVNGKGRIKVTKGKFRINAKLLGYGKNKDFGQVKKTFKPAKGFKYVYGDEVNELITNHKTTRTKFVKRYKKKDWGSIVFTFKKGKLTKAKIVYD